MSVSKIVDLRNQSEAGEYGVAFASRQTTGDYDHAFMIWYYSDPSNHRTVRRGAGFYGVAAENAFDLVLGTSGGLLDDSRERIDHQLIVLVSKPTFDASIAVEIRYGNGETYRLGFNDCTTFVESVAKAVAGLTVPSRLANLFPNRFIRAMFDAN